MPVELFLAWRYFTSKKRHPFIGLMSKISIAGVSVGVAALVVVLAVMSGFERDLIDRIVGTYSHSMIEAEAPFEVSDAWTEKLVAASSQKILSTAPFIRQQALIQSHIGSQGVVIKGSDGAKERRVSMLDEYMKDGIYPAEGFPQILLGDVLAQSLGVQIKDTVEFQTQHQKKPIKLIVSGIFHSGMYDYDANLVYIPLTLAQEVYKLEGKVTHVALEYESPVKAIQDQLALQRHLGYPYYVRTWKDMNQVLFGALKLEKTVMFLILGLIVLVACFNVIGTLTLAVMDKTRDIGILKSLGIGNGSIRRIFVMMGLFSGVVGVAVGISLGWSITYVLANYKIIDIPTEIYYFDQLPVDLRTSDVMTIGIAALALTLLSSWYPAFLAGRLKIVEALRYE